jgi:hypothetical protein
LIGNQAVCANDGFLLGFFCIVRELSVTPSRLIPGIFPKSAHQFFYPDNRDSNFLSARFYNIVNEADLLDAADKLNSHLEQQPASANVVGIKR